MVKILHIQRAGAIAGAENHLLHLLPGLQQRGYDVTFLALTKPQEAPSPFAAALRRRGIPVIDRWVHSEWQPDLLPQLVHLLRQGNYDLVHTHLLYADLYGGVAARCLPGLKVLCTRHNDNRYRQRWPMRPLITWNTRCFHHVIAISEHIKRFNQRYQRVPAEKITVIPYGYDPPAGEFPTTPKSSGPFVLGMVGRLVPQKSHATALYALPLIRQRIPQVRLVIVGDGPLREPLKTLAAQLQVTAHVDLVGYQPQAGEWMRQFDLLVHPSLHEGFGLVLLEAMAARLPIVATRVSAIPEIVIDGKTGLLIPPNDPPALAQAVIQLLTNPEQRAGMGAAGYARLVQEFTVAQMVERTANLYQSLLSSA